MQAPQSPSSPVLTPQDCVSLLEGRLGTREFRASEGLKALFEEIARIAGKYSSSRHEISSRFLFFAAAEAGLSSRYDDREREALHNLQIFSRRETAPYAEQRNAYFQKGKGPTGTVPPTLSAKIEQLLGSAISHAGERQASDRIVTVVDLLIGFPPKASNAEALMAKLGIDPDAFREGFAEMVRRWDAASTEGGGTAGEEESPPAETGDWEPEIPSSPPYARPLFNDSVATHCDEPAITDQLERGPFASVLARNIIEARASGESNASAFIVHLHGPWGAGKSSVLNFLEARLMEADEPWLVVRFNAWRDQRRQPPWWSLITCIYAGARTKLDRKTSKRLWWRWFKWRVRADYMPWAVSAALVVVCAALLILGFTSAIGPTVSALGTTITLLGAGAVAVRSLALGSQRAAQTYAELKADPFQPMTILFDRLIAGI